MLCALIMAGGKGSRFWPLSTEEKPKQFLKLIADETMIQMTVKRIEEIIPIENIFICTTRQYSKLVEEQLSKLPKKNIIIEPETKNTAPCIALSSLIIKRYYGDASVLVLPADHLVQKEDEFRRTILNSYEYLKKNKSSIITLGIEPNRPETEYGYIKCSRYKEKVNEQEVIAVKSFVEKPNYKRALEYLNDGSYLWNSGMFMWRIENIINKIKMYCPNIYNQLYKVECISEEKLSEYVEKNYKDIEAISIDYAVLERASNIYVIKCEFKWDDIGSWQAIERYRESDENGNIHIGLSKTIDGNDNLLVTTGGNIIVHGLSDIYVIENHGQIIVGKKKNVCNIKELKGG